MSEVATREMIRAKISSFPSGNDTECLSKAEALATTEALINGSYGDAECPVIDDVKGANVYWGYVDANGIKHQLSPIFDGAIVLDSIPDEDYYILLFRNSPEMANILKLEIIIERKLANGDSFLWLKMPAVDDFGSCSLDFSKYRIDGSTFYVNFLPKYFFGSRISNAEYRLTIRGYNAYPGNGNQIYCHYMEFTIAA